MKYINQFLIIAGVSFVGELLNKIIPFPVPGSVYGLLLMFILLSTKVIKLHQVEDVADWMISVMPIFFIPPTVGLITVVGHLSAMTIVAIIAISVVSTFAVMFVSGHTSQAIIRMKRKRLSDANGLSVEGGEAE